MQKDCQSNEKKQSMEAKIVKMLGINGEEKISLQIRCDAFSIPQVIPLDELLAAAGIEIKQYSFDKKEDVLSKVTYSIVNLSKNQKILKNIPHKVWNDLSVIYEIQWSSEKFNNNTIINNKMMKRLGISFEELDEAAYINTVKQKHNITTLFDKFLAMGFLDDDSKNEEMKKYYVGTNLAMHHGANILLFPEVFHSLAKEKQCDLLLLPSSKDEILLVPDNGTISVKELQTVVCIMNCEEVNERNFLSDSIYKYCRKTKQIFKIA